jgi:two-component system, NtrC family, sensor kinase
MRSSGLRLQLLFLLGGLLVLAFVPLLWALSTYTNFTLRQIDDVQARALSRTFAAYVQQAEPHLGTERLIAALERDCSEQGLAAAQIVDASGGPIAEFGRPAILAVLQKHSASFASEPRQLRTPEGRILALTAGSKGGVRLAVFADASSGRANTLSGLFALYAFLIAVSLLIVAYFALTRLIVRPLGALSEAAQGVTLGSRHLAVPETRVRELSLLADSLKRMTDRLLLEEQSLRHKIAEVERATEELERAQTQVIRSERLASVGRLAAGLAHEIGNPLAALMGLTDVLLEAELEPHEQRDFVRRMRAETERIHRTLGDLLAFARPAREVKTAQPAAGDVETAVHDTAALVMHQSSLRDVELRIDVYPGLPKVTLATQQLMQVLLNLILNAADALQGKARAALTVTGRATPRGVQLSVEDNGAGVPAAVADQIFEPFFTTKEVGKGTGLGLSVCQGLLAAAGGSLSLDASFKNGARFIVELPSADAAVTASEAASAAQNPSPAQNAVAESTGPE